MLKIIKKKQITNTIFVMIFFFVDRISKLLIIGLADQNEQINITVTSFLNLNLICKFRDLFQIVDYIFFLKT